MWYYISCQFCTIGVKINSRGEIIDYPPLIRRFIGQRLNRLTYWLKKFGEVDIVKMS